MITLTIKNLDAIKRIASKFPAVSRKHIDKAIYNALLRVWAKEKQEAPVRTGNLRDRWSIQVSPFKGILRSNVKYGIFVHEGTGLYGKNHRLIVPVYKKALYWKGADHPVMWSRGQRPNPFLQRAVEQSAGEINKVFKAALDSITKELAQS